MYLGTITKRLLEEEWPLTSDWWICCRTTCVILPDLWFRFFTFNFKIFWWIKEEKDIQFSSNEFYVFFIFIGFHIFATWHKFLSSFLQFLKMTWHKHITTFKVECKIDRVKQEAEWFGRVMSLLPKKKSWYVKRKKFLDV